MKLSNNIFLLLFATMGVSGVYGMNLNDECSEAEKQDNYKCLNYSKIEQLGNVNKSLTNQLKEAQDNPEQYFAKKFITNKNYRDKFSFVQLFFEQSKDKKGGTLTYNPFYIPEKYDNNSIVISTDAEVDKATEKSLIEAVKEINIKASHRTTIKYEENDIENTSRSFNVSMTGLKKIKTIIVDDFKKTNEYKESMDTAAENALKRQSVFAKNPGKTFFLGSSIGVLSTLAIVFHKPLLTFVTKLTSKNTMENENDEGNEDTSNNSEDTNVQE